MPYKDKDVTQVVNRSNGLVRELDKRTAGKLLLICRSLKAHNVLEQVILGCTDNSMPLSDIYDRLEGKGA